MYMKYKYKLVKGDCKPTGRTRLTRWFFSWGSRACQHASPRCVDCSLSGSAANWHHPPSPHKVHFWGRFLRCPRCGLGGWCQLAAEPPSERSTQQGLAWWQPSKPQDKNHRIILVFSLVCILITQACIYFHIHCASVVALVISLLM